MGENFILSESTLKMAVHRKHFSCFSSLGAAALTHTHLIELCIVRRRCVALRPWGGCCAHPRSDS